MADLSKKIVAYFPIPFENKKKGIKGSRVYVRTGDATVYEFGTYHENQTGNIPKDIGPEAYPFESAKDYNEHIKGLVADLQTRHTGVTLFFKP